MTPIMSKKEGSYEVISIEPNNYTFANFSGYGYLISWRYINGQAILYFEIDKIGTSSLNLN